MKKPIYLLALAITSTSLTSCYKSWTCVCEIATKEDNRPVADYEYTHNDFLTTRKKATEACDKGDDFNDYGTFSVTRDCHLTE